MAQRRPRTVGRKRSEATRQAILDASLTLLEENGYAALTTDAIASRAGAGKQTIYRWWGSKADVVLEALSARGRAIELPETGRLESDLRAFLESTFRTLRGPRGSGRVLQGLMAQAQLDEAFAVRFHAFLKQRRGALRSLLAKHVRRAADLDAAVDAAIGAMWYRLLAQHATLDIKFARQLASVVTRGLTAQRA